MAVRHWLQLAMTNGIGPVLIRRLIEATGSAEAACEVSIAQLRKIDGIGTTKATSISDSMARAGIDVQKELDRAATANVTVLCPDDDEYPVLLKEIPDPPAVLYVRGQLEPRDLHSVAIVGSRKCSLYGREQAERFAALLAGAGVSVISGGARGIDSSAHRGAMQPLNGRTIAVLGSGVDVAYPPENDSLFKQIAADGRGAVVSEYPMGTPPVAENFPRRNRIISGLSRGVLVIEADLRSGALITARQAIDDHGRTVFALPGRVDMPTSAGPHKLIRDGATLVTKLEDILDHLGPLPQRATEANLFESTDAKLENSAPRVELSEPQQKIIEALNGASLDADGIIDATGLSASLVMQQLTLMTLRGVIKKENATQYCAARR